MNEEEEVIMLEKFMNIIPSSWIFFTISIILLIISFSFKNNNFFDVRRIFIQHFNVFNGNRFQIMLFFVVPLLIAVGIVKVKLIDKDIINNMNIIISIFISMFFAMLSILCSFQPREPNNKDNTNNNYNQLLNETYNSILFEACLCILLLTLTFIELFIDSFVSSWQIFISSIVIYYLLLVIVFNIFLILKRIKKLFDNR